MTDSKQKLDELQWKSPEWIQSFGLRTDNVLEYFSESPFFDRTSNNQTVKMQSQFQEGYQANSAHLEEELKKLVGVEFVILHRREPDFWIIRKQNRKSPELVEPMADYFIIGADVYMAPTVKDVISSRLLSTALSLKESMNKLQMLAQFTPSDGHTYKVQQPTAGAPDSASSSRSRTLGNTPYTPTTPGFQAVGTSDKNDQLSRGTIDNLFNISLNGTPAYVEDETSENNIESLTKPIRPQVSIRQTSDEATISSLKKGKRSIQ